MNSLADAYLDHILIYLKSNERGSPPLRMFLDNWFAYSHQGPFLSPNGNPVWFNNPDPSKLKVREALLSMHYVSKGAIDVINGDSDDKLVKEHSVPISILKDILYSKMPKNKSTLNNLLLTYYRLGVLTKTEDNLLKTNGLNSKMPKNWNSTMNVFARYDQCGIIKVGGVIND